MGRINERIFTYLGLLPVHDHYYQPLINPNKHLTKSLRENRHLPGIDFNDKEQLELLSGFDYNTELIQIPLEQKKPNEFYYNNGSYCSGDAEYLYSMIRHFKPENIIEIGSGSSTLICRKAIEKNSTESNYKCNHVCIEPYEQPWLNEIGVELIRKKVEDINLDFFNILGKNDILFVDSSHIIRPQGDVLYEYLEILPTLNQGVFVHVHDIFTPKDYLDEWIFKDHNLWNEQYLLEAFLTYNSKFKIIGALNYLSHNYSEIFKLKCPIYAIQENREPGAFWIEKK